DIVAQVADEGYRQRHVIVVIVKGHLRFNHPELGKVARGVRVLCPEARSKSINLIQGERMGFAFELSRYGEVGFPSEEVFPEINAAVFRSGWVVSVQGRDPEHGTGTFCVGSRYNGRVNINETAIVKKSVNGVSERVAYPHHCTERVGSGPQMRDFAEELQRMALGLKGIFFRVAVAEDDNGRNPDFHLLSFCGRGHQGAFGTNAGAGRNALQDRLVGRLVVDDKLYGVDGRAVAEGNKLIVAESPDPAHYQDGLTGRFEGEQLFYSGSLHA